MKRRSRRKKQGGQLLSENAVILLALALTCIALGVGGAIWINGWY